MFSERVGYLTRMFVVSTTLTLYTMVKSKRLSGFLDAASDKRLSTRNKLRALAAVWRRGTDG